MSRGRFPNDALHCKTTTLNSVNIVNHNSLLDPTLIFTLRINVGHINF